MALGALGALGAQEAPEVVDKEGDAIGRSWRWPHRCKMMKGK